MGTSQSHKKQIPSYPQLVHFEMRNQDLSGKHFTKMGFVLTDPISQHSLKAILEDKPVTVSGCVLPGQDLTNTSPKTCQDNYSFVIYENTLLLVLFDGHGPNGHFIAEHCIDYFTQYFYKNFKDFLYDTQNAFREMFEGCDESMKTGEVDCSLSGSTCVAVLVTASHLYCASVGDSRAILVSGEYKDVSNYVQLTTDQKPNHKNEYQRIIGAGGEVRRFTNEAGFKRGPFRIWKPNSTLPGLAMSRSLGDFLAKSVGAIPAPLFMLTELQLRDKFIVIASDGVWDVMSNQRVADFVLKNYESCSLEPSKIYPASNSNSTISRLLCEHARSRWFKADSIERSSVDDICVIVIKISELKAKYKDRTLKFNCTLDDFEYVGQDFE